MIHPQLNQQPTDVVVGTQPLNQLPKKHPLIAKGFITKQSVVHQGVVTRVDLILKINRDVVRVFINSDHPYFSWWLTQPDESFYAQMKFMIQSFNQQYENYKGELYTFVPEAYVDNEAVLATNLKSHLGVHYKKLKSESLKRLWCTFLTNEQLKEHFYQAPSSKSNAYSFKGGLAMHTATLMDKIEAYVAASIPQYIEYYRPGPLNVDLMKTAALFHDLGKMFAYQFEDGFIVDTPEGRFLGTTTLSLQLLNRMYAEMIQEHPELALPYQEYLELQHIVASANRKLEYGALVVPKTKEAAIFAFLENAESVLGDYQSLEQNYAEPGFRKLFGNYVYVNPYHGDYSEFYPNPQELEETVEASSMEDIVIEPIAQPTDDTFDESTDYEEDLTYQPLLEIKEEAVVSDESMDYEEDLTYEPLLEPTSSDVVVNEDIQPVLVEEPVVVPLETPFVGEMTQQVATAGDQPAFISPVMNIPQTWPQTPSTAPVLVNGMPPQPIMSIQQPIDSSVVFTPTPTVEAIVTSSESDTSVIGTSLADVIPFEPKSQKSVEQVIEGSTEEVVEPVEEVVTKPKTTRKTTKTTKTKEKDSATTSKPKTTKKTTKTTKATKTETPTEPLVEETSLNA